MNKAEEYRKIAEVVMEQNRKKRSEACIRNREKSEQCTFWAKLQYRKILRKLRKAASRGKYSYTANFWTTFSVIDKLQKDGFEVYFHDWKGERKKDCKLFSVLIPEL